MAELRFYYDARETRDGQATNLRDLVVAVKAVTTPGAVQHRKRLTIAPGASVRIFDYEDIQDGGADLVPFTAIVMQILGGEGALYLSKGVCLADADGLPDTPVSNMRWTDGEMVSCFAPWILSHQAALWNPTAADHTGGGVDGPDLFDDAGTVTGKVYYVDVQNPGAEDVLIDVAVFG